MAKWIVDTDHSVAAFSVRHMMIAHVRGQFNNLTGTIYFDPSHMNASSVQVTINASSIITGIQKRDDHLKGRIFDVDKYPDILFKAAG
jgi:polyisoprenoid-binding protein YceI